MAATYTVREVLWRVSGLLNDTDPQFDRWPEIELVGWLNDAHLAIAKFLPMASSRVDAIKLKPGTRQSLETIAAADCIPGDGTTPTAPILGMQLLSLNRNMGASGASPGRTIRVVDRDVLDAQLSGWHTVTGTEVREFTYDPQVPRYFYVSPGVHASTAVWVEAAYNAQPIRIPAGGNPGSEVYLFSGSNATKISLADEYMDDLVNYTAARARMKNNDVTGEGNANIFAQMFLGSLNSKVQAVSGSNPNLKQLPFTVGATGASS